MYINIRKVIYQKNYFKYSVGYKNHLDEAALLLIQLPN